MKTVARTRLAYLLLVPVLCAVTLVGLCPPASGELGQEPQPQDRQVALIVSSLMRRQHLSRRKVDDEISRRSLTGFLKSLDPMKVYFTQADIDEFVQQADSLDDMVLRGDISFAYTVFNRFLKRVDERVETVNKLLAGDFDFTADESLVTDPDEAKYPKTAEQAEERWRQRLKYDLLVLKSDDVEGEAARDRLRRRYESFRKRMHQTDSDELLEMFLTSITSSFDPHTTYMSPTNLKNFQILMSLRLEGIGAALQVTDGYTVVSKIIPGGAADKQGDLKVEDRIVSVGQGEDGEMVDVVDMKLNEVVNLIRGEAGTTVRLGVKPAGSTDLKTISIKRAKIELTDSEAQSEIVTDEKLVGQNGKPLKLGYIDLPSFYMDMEGARANLPNYKSTTRDVRRILREFEKEEVDAVILDLRRNGGGSLTEAINLTGLFIDTGPVVQVKDDQGVDTYKDYERGMEWDGPLVVLTSKFSASASEILAGAIQDYGRGIIVGDESTHGKGTVQSLLDLGSQLFRIPNPPNLGALKITIQQFYRPNGDSTQKRGVLADISLPSLSNHMDISEADLDYAMEFDKVPAASYERYNMVDEAMLNKIRGRSIERRRNSEDFAKLLRNIERYKTQKARTSVQLNEQAFFADRAELDADKEDEKQIEDQLNGGGSKVKRDYYFNEILSITADYLAELRNNKVARAN